MVRESRCKGRGLRAAIILLMGILVLGLGCWRYSDRDETATWQNITPEEAREMLASKDDVLLLDVREDFEFQARRIPGSIHIPLGELMTGRENELKSGKTYIIVCRTGNRSRTAAQYLIELGNKWTLYNLQGGVVSWPYDLEGEEVD